MLDSDSLSKLYEYSVASNANLDFSKQLGIKGKDWFLIEKLTNYNGLTILKRNEIY
jgi:hypothetical protein